MKSDISKLFPELFGHKLDSLSASSCNDEVALLVILSIIKLRKHLAPAFPKVTMDSSCNSSIKIKLIRGTISLQSKYSCATSGELRNWLKNIAICSSYCRLWLLVKLKLKWYSSFPALPCKAKLLPWGHHQNKSICIS